MNVFVYGTLKSSSLVRYQPVAHLYEKPRINVSINGKLFLIPGMPSCFPALKLEGESNVLGEVITDLTEKDIYLLDQIESEGKLYKRKTVDIENIGETFVYEFIEEITKECFEITHGNFEQLILEQDSYQFLAFPLETPSKTEKTQIYVENPYYCLAKVKLNF